MVGAQGAELTHCATLELETDELVTFTTTSGTEFDVVRKSWGYYGTPSVNARLRDHGLRAALALGRPRPDSSQERLYVLLVEDGREKDMEAYLDMEGMRLLAWLDSDAAVESLVGSLEARGGRARTAQPGRPG